MLYVIFTIYKTTEHSFVQIKQRLFCRFWNIYFTFHFHSITYTCKLCLCFFSFLLLFTPTIKTSRPLFFCFCFVLFCRKHRIFVFNYVSLVFHFVYQRLRFWFPAFFFLWKSSFLLSRDHPPNVGVIGIEFATERGVCVFVCGRYSSSTAFILLGKVCLLEVRRRRSIVCKCLALGAFFFYFCEQCGDVFVCFCDSIIKIKHSEQMWIHFLPLFIVYFL